MDLSPAEAKRAIREDMEQVVVFIEDWPPKQCVNVCEGKP